MIKNFEQFINESSEQDFKVSDIFSTLTRNYESKKMFYTDLLQFVVEEERRDWGDIRAKAELEKNKSEDGFYKLVFVLDEKKHLLEINFSFTYRGTKEKDAPETASEENLNRLNVILEDVRVKKILLEASGFNYKSSSPSKAVLDSCQKFMVKMMEVDYDTLGSKIYNLQQK